MIAPSVLRNQRVGTLLAAIEEKGPFKMLGCLFVLVMIGRMTYAVLYALLVEFTIHICGSIYILYMVI